MRSASPATYWHEPGGRAEDRLAAFHFDTHSGRMERPKDPFGMLDFKVRRRGAPLDLKQSAPAGAVRVTAHRPRWRFLDPRLMQQMLKAELMILDEWGVQK